uniref:Uncharacterized protein n=1 Tax=Aegilops tauschii subsp. strangulata TaxID=200361 RepID=A0A453LID6_AEGTS
LSCSVFLDPSLPSPVASSLTPRHRSPPTPFYINRRSPGGRHSGAHLDGGHGDEREDRRVRRPRRRARLQVPRGKLTD